jgi:hypothetical protein
MNCVSIGFENIYVPGLMNNLSGRLAIVADILEHLSARYWHS